MEIDWKMLPQAEDARRISLPTYPFEKERCWVKQGKSAKVKKEMLVKKKAADISAKEVKKPSKKEKIKVK